MKSITLPFWSNCVVAFFGIIANYYMSCVIITRNANGLFLTRANSANDTKKQDYFFHGIEFRKLNYK